MTNDTSVENAVAALRAVVRPRAKSLIVTVWGDAIAPRGAVVWLGSLIALMRPLGVNERAVRTTVFRLQKDDWLTSRQIGRRSYYAFSETGIRRAAQADRRIYAAGPPGWDGRWHLVIANTRDIPAKQREALRRELLWQGFGTLAPGCHAHPAADEDALADLLAELGLAEAVVVMRADRDRLTTDRSLRRMVESGWDTARLGTAWREVVDHFHPVREALLGADPPDPETCFVLRSLLIHEVRRVLLRDPMLPEELLPADWAGAAARRLCQDLYRRLWRPAERHLTAVLRTADGPLPDPGSAFYRRFGGLDNDTDKGAAA